MAIQRFGGALNLNVHFHALYTEGCFYERSDGQPVFLHAAPPTLAELAALVADIKRRVVELLEKLDLGPDEDDDWDAQQLLLGMGELYGEGVFDKGAQRLPNGKHRTPSTFARRKAQEDGFDLDAYVIVSAGARASLEQLVRYILRQRFKEARLTLHATGVELTLKTPWSDGTTQILLTTDRFIDRLVALVPPAARQHPALWRPVRRQRPPPPPVGGYTLRILMQIGVAPETVFHFATLDGATPEAAGLAEEGLVAARTIEERAHRSDLEGRVLWLGLAARAACVAGDQLGTIRLLRAAYRAGRGSTYDPERDLAFVRDHSDSCLRARLVNQGFPFN